MSKRKIIILVLLAVAMISVTYLIGFFVGFQKGMRTGGMTKSLAELSQFYDHLKIQMENADCEGLKKALNAYIAILDKYKDAEDSIILSRTAYYSDMMLVHGRLAMIENKLGNEMAARDHMRIALEFCAKRDWMECSEDKIFSVIQRLHEKIPIACLKDD